MTEENPSPDESPWWCDLPDCAACHCPVQAHRSEMTVEGDQARIKFGPCRRCKCPQYTLEVANPRTSFQVKLSKGVF